MIDERRQIVIEIVVDDKGAVLKLGDVDKAQTRVQQSTKSSAVAMGELENAMFRGSRAGAFVASVLQDLAGTTMRAVYRGFQDSIKSASTFNNTFVGLGSIAKANGVAMDEAKRAAQQLSSDGLMAVSESATGLKNLLAAGFNMPQAITLMQRFKDSAAFGRQGSLEFGQAIVSATEGIKNQNSILVDNAGVTKNLSVILKEAGYSAQDLSRVQTDAGVRQALYNGILKETNAQVGDAAKLTETYSGSQARFNQKIFEAKAAIGQQYLPLAKQLYDTLTPLLDITSQHSKAVAGLALSAAPAAVGLGALATAGAAGLVSFTALAPAVLAVTAAVGAGLFLWQQFNSSLDEFNDRTNGAARGADALTQKIEAARKSFHLIGGQYAYTTDELRKLVEAKKITAEEAAVLATATKVEGDALKGLGLHIKGATAGNVELAAAQLKVADAERQYRGDIDKHGAALRLEIANMKTTGATVKELAEHYGVAETSVRRLQEEMTTGTKATSKANDEFKKLKEQLAGKEVIDDALQLARAVQEVGGVSALTAKEQSHLVDVVGEAIDKYDALGQSAPAALRAIYFEAEALTHKMEKVKLALKDPLARGGEVLEPWQGTHPWIPPITKQPLVVKESMFAGLSDVLSKDLPAAIMAAFTGGGSPVKAAGSLLGNKLGTHVAETFGTAISGKIGNLLGGAINTLLPGLGTMLGPLASKLFEWFKGIGGPSKEEQAGRSEARSFEDTLIKTLNATQQAEAGSERWKQVVIAVRDQYVAAGKSAAEAEAVVKRLWEAEKRGPEAVKAVEDEIKNVIAIADQARAKTEEAARIFRESQEQAFSQTEKELTDLIQRRDQLAQGVAAEAAEENMGVIEAAQREQLKVLDQQINEKADQYKTLAEQMGKAMSDAIVDALKRIQVDPIHVPVVVDAAGAGDGNTYHTGTEYVRRGSSWRVAPFQRAVVAHAGMASDEVPAILQTGEAVLNRRAVAALGPERIRAWNKGLASGGGGVNVSVGNVSVSVSSDMSEDEVAWSTGRALVARMKSQGVRFS